jgi:hypothetical protein
MQTAHMAPAVGGKRPAVSSNVPIASRDPGRNQTRFFPPLAYRGKILKTSSLTVTQSGTWLVTLVTRTPASCTAGRARPCRHDTPTCETAHPCAAPKPGQLSPYPLWPFGCAVVMCGFLAFHPGASHHMGSIFLCLPADQAEQSATPRETVNHACCRDRPGGRTVDVKRPSTQRAESGSGAFPSLRAHLTTPFRGASSLDGLLSADPVISHAAAGPMQN